MIRAVPVAVFAAALAAPAPLATEAAFHHFHFRVGDPAAAMNRGAASLSGTRVLLRGFGVGVRVRGVFALFDRADATEVGRRAQSPEDAYAAAAAWLRARGVGVAEAGPARTALAETFASEILDHVGFLTADLSRAIDDLAARGVRASRRTPEAAFFDSGDGVTIELLRDPEAPDAFWCPMHPDVRSASAGPCPLCRMALVPIPPFRLGEYRMNVALTPGSSGRGASKVRVTLLDPETNRPVTALASIHERLLHLFIVDRGLELFRHVHPDRVAPGIFEIAEQLPPGEYTVIADFFPERGAAQMVQRTVVTPGYRGMLFGAPPDLASQIASEAVAAGVRVRVEARDLKAGKEAMLRFTIAEAGGEPVSDLEPFLGAPAHMLIVNHDVTEADHVHPEEPATRGPSVSFRPLLPAGGFYKLWVQFQRRGTVITVPFVISVEER